MKDETISAYLIELGSKDGVSGGGSAAAYTGAMSASLARMVADIQKDKKTYAKQRGRLTELLNESERIKNAYEALAKADAVAFEPVLDAYKLPKETAEEKADRNQAVEEALEGAVKPPLSMLAEGLNLIRVLEELAAMRMKGTIVNDLLVATLFIESVLETAVLNVTINTKLMKDRDLKERLEKEAEDDLVRGKIRATRLSETIRFFLEQGQWSDQALEEE